MNDPCCEVCGHEMTAEFDDLDEDGVSYTAACCDRSGLCADCREPGHHDCDGGAGVAPHAVDHQCLLGSTLLAMPEHE